jgi:hypothetical protein
MAPEYTFEDLIDSLAGLTVKQLETLNAALVETLRLKRKMEARKIAGTLEVGMIVRIRANVKPKYLAGKLCTIESFQGERVNLRLVGGPAGKFRNGKLIAPITMIEVP